MAFLDCKGNPISEDSREKKNVTVAGPLCFAGDNISSNRIMPIPQIGDVVVIFDAGANTMAMYSRHCSRQCPPVFGFKVNDGGGAVSIVCIKMLESEECLLNFWG